MNPHEGTGLYVVFAWRDPITFQKQDIGLPNIRHSKKICKLFDAWAKKFNYDWKSGISAYLNDVDVFQFQQQSLSVILNECGIRETDLKADEYKLRFEIRFLYNVQFSWLDDRSNPVHRIQHIDIDQPLRDIVRNWCTKDNIPFNRTLQFELNDSIQLNRDRHLLRSAKTYIQYLQKIDGDRAKLLDNLEIKITFFRSGG